MVSPKKKLLEKYQRKIVALEKALGRERRKLRALPARHGFKSVDELIAALRDAAQGTAAAAGPAVRRRAGRTRAKITAATKAAVKKLVALKKKGREIAKELGISLPSVQNIKKELGLTRKRA
jgi:hypothetical protein